MQRFESGKNVAGKKKKYFIYTCMLEQMVACWVGKQNSFFGEENGTCKSMKKFKQIQNVMRSDKCYTRSLPLFLDLKNTYLAFLLFLLNTGSSQKVNNVRKLIFTITSCEEINYIFKKRRDFSHTVCKEEQIFY